MKIKENLKITEEESAMIRRFNHPEPIDVHLNHPHPHHPVPPHLRRDMLQLEFTDTDFDILCKVFEDEDSAYAAAEVILKAPPEIQVLAIQIMNMIEEVK